METKTNGGEEAVSLLDPQTFDLEVEADIKDAAYASKRRRRCTWFHWLEGIPIPRTPIWKHIFLLFVTLLPSWLAQRVFPGRVAAPPSLTKVHRTSWLDGLRGAAALAVVSYHWANMVYLNADVAYGALGSGRSTSILQLPIIRLLYGGLNNVSLFFVISGYALSVRPVELMAEGPASQARLMSGFTSSIFRRFFRLYLPAWTATIGPALWQWADMPQALGLWDMNAFNRWTTYEDSYNTRYNVTVPEPTPSVVTRDVLPVVVGKLSHWTEANLNMTVLLEGSWTRERFENPYDAPLWTIPIEFRASLLLFLVQIALCQRTLKTRVSITLFLMAYAVYCDRFEMILFLGGWLIAQIDPAIKDWELKLRDRRARWRAWSTGHCCILFGGLYLASYPMWNAANTPGYSWLAAHAPRTPYLKDYFWFGIGALLIVYSMGRIPVCCRMFASPPLQYAGRISFSIYLIHGFTSGIVGTVSLYFSAWATGNLDRHSMPLYAVSFATSLAVIYFVAAWWADVFWRHVDMPSVRFTKWLDTKLSDRT